MLISYADIFYLNEDNSGYFAQLGTTGSSCPGKWKLVHHYFLRDFFFLLIEAQQNILDSLTLIEILKSDLVQGQYGGIGYLVGNLFSCNW